MSVFIFVCRSEEKKNTFLHSLQIIVKLYLHLGSSFSAKQTILFLDNAPGHLGQLFV